MEVWNACELAGEGNSSCTNHTAHENIQGTCTFSLACLLRNLSRRLTMKIVVLNVCA